MQLRILSGSLKNRSIYFEKDRFLRPTRNIVRKSFFDTVQFKVEGAIFLDLFAGTGSIGIEALSRGAKEVFFVDSSPKSVDIISKNIGVFGRDNVHIYKIDAQRFLYTPYIDRIDLAYIDPPYSFDINAFLKIFFQRANSNIYVCVEHKSNVILEDKFCRFFKIKSKKFGKNMLDYFEGENG